MAHKMSERTRIQEKRSDPKRMIDTDEHLWVTLVMSGVGEGEAYQKVFRQRATMGALKRLKNRPVVRVALERMMKKREDVAFQLTEECRKLGKDALETLRKIMLEAKYERERREAAEAILDRGFGRPVERLEQDIKVVIDL